MPQLGGIHLVLICYVKKDKNPVFLPLLFAANQCLKIKDAVCTVNLGSMCCLVNSLSFSDSQPRENHTG